MSKLNNKDFLYKSMETGRFLVRSKRTGRTYYVEPQGDPHVDWGSIDQSTGKLNVKKGWKKNRGSTEKEDSMITKENGFENIVTLSKGQSPLEYIESIDSQYPSI